MAFDQASGPGLGYETHAVTEKGGNLFAVGVSGLAPGRRSRRYHGVGGVKISRQPASAISSTRKGDPPRSARRWAVKGSTRDGGVDQVSREAIRMIQPPPVGSLPSWK